MTIPLPHLRAAAIPALFSIVLAGCAATSVPETRGGMQGQQGMAMDMQAMCDTHRQRMAGKSPQERQAMMDEHMRSMSPEMRGRMQSMMEQCR